MERTIERNGMKVLTAEELRQVVGGTDDPAVPIGDPAESGGDLDVSPQWFYGRR